ncbi:MAG: peroxiredoxin family protein [Candidatus Bathyarchaeia archaeon]
MSLAIVLTFGANPVVGKEKAPDFTLIDINGNEFSLSNQLGKVVILSFLAIECYYCRLEMPHLRTLYDKYSPDQLMIISISVHL